LSTLLDKCAVKGNKQIYKVTKHDLYLICPLLVLFEEHLSWIKSELTHQPHVG